MQIGSQPYDARAHLAFVAECVVGGREFRNGDEVADWLKNYPVDPEHEKMKLRARSEPSRPTW